MSRDNIVVTFTHKLWRETLAHGHDSSQNRSTKVAWKFIFFIHVPTTIDKSTFTFVVRPIFHIYALYHTPQTQLVSLKITNLIIILLPWPSH
jgi:hypothetical protein